MIAIRYLIFVSLVASMVGCASDTSATRGGYQTLAKDPTRDAALANKEQTIGLKAMDEGNWKDAEAAFKRALTADITNGPAHNNLGKVYWHEDQRYLAAWEFDYAAKLMPNQPEPKNNLGLVFESVGKLDDAVADYQQAESMEPDNPQFIGNLARARLRRGDSVASVQTLLDRLLMRDTRPEWLYWAKENLVRSPTTVPVGGM